MTTPQWALSIDSVPGRADLRSRDVPGISLNISDESHEGWTRFAQEHGVSLAVLFEVMGRHLNKGGILRQRALDDLVKEARELTHERRRAGGPRRKTS